MKTDYEQQAVDFLTSTNTTFQANFLTWGKHFEDDKEGRDIYEITLQRGPRKYTFNFGQSIRNSCKWEPLTAYARQRMPLIGDSAQSVMRKYNLAQFDFRENNHYSSPTAYDVLACLTKDDPGTFENFCNEFGYDTDSRKAEKTYHAVVDEYQMVCALWNEEELEQLREIQ